MDLLRDATEITLERRGDFDLLRDATEITLARGRRDLDLAREVTIFTGGNFSIRTTNKNRTFQLEFLALLSITTRQQLDTALSCLINITNPTAVINSRFLIPLAELRCNGVLQDTRCRRV